jgi:U4/U6 small nuclear ribonucleoprotein PRP3
LLEQRKASKLSDKICDAVDEFLLARDLPKLNHSNGSRKRSSNDQQGEAEDEPLSKMAKPDDIINMTPAQIRAMMANTMKQIQERKAALAGIRGNSGLSESTAKVSLPPPRVMNVVNAPSIHKTMDTAATIAALQARISNSLEKIGPIAPPPSVQQQQQQQPGILAAYDRPTAVILDDKGRTVDSTGQQITLTQHVPTLKANLRAKRNKDEIRDKEPSGAPQERDEVKFFDGRVAVKGVSRHKRTTFNFIEPGQYQREGQRLRMKAQLEKLQAEISTISRKTGITSATQLAKLVPKGDEKSATPDVEWWDALILSNGHSSQYDIKELREEAISKLVEHPIQLKPLEPAKHAHVPVFLTKKEQKKLRRQNRREAWSEKQDKIRLGILPPDQPKVKISNMMRVLESDAVQDPTKVEAHVRAQMAKRLANHEKMNSERKLTSDERKEKTLRKLKEDTSAGVRVSVYRVKNLSNPSKKFKVETNAKQLFMTGCVILYEDVNVVVVEGGPKQQKKYKQLMMNRIKWDEEFIKDKEGQELVNRCTLVWEGETKERHFVEFKFKQCPTESFAREFFKNAGVEHYWDQAYSGAVLENADIDI